MSNAQNAQPASLNYRRRLLTIVDAFLQGTSVNHARVYRLVDRLYHDPRRRGWTLDDLVWGGFVSELTDSEFYERPDYLQETRETLLHGSPELRRAYLNYDFRPYFSDAEREWYEHLLGLATWLRSDNPFGNNAGEAEYGRRSAAIAAVQAQTPAPTALGDETLYHFILRTAAAVLTGIDAYHSVRLGYLVAAAPLTYYHWDPNAPMRPPFPPDAAASVEWSERALHAVALESWVWMTWQVTPAGYLVSLH